MWSFLKPAAGLTCLFALATAGCSADSDDTSDAASATTGQSSAAPAEEPASTTSYAPYLSATTASGLDSNGSPATYNLAFVISDGDGCTPTWNGTHAIGDASVKSRVARLKEAGATVRVSFGGASGEELAATCESASELAEAYGRALDAAGSAQADFDIEGDELTDSDSVDLRSAAIARLQKERTGLSVSFTLPVMPSGLDDDGLALLGSANKAAHTQLADVFGLSSSAAWRGMALTSMIGVNDVEGETFTLSDAAQVRAFAEEKEIAWVSMWSTARDQQCEEGTSGEDDPATDCSGVEQGSGAFAKAFSGRSASAVDEASRAHRRDAHAPLVEHGEVGAAGLTDGRLP
ncbi:hypothetical protein [Streptomyces resistomycificus]|uniref:hypothetical protein n=1 Tax=Streptomyces resistomycificus TaxID=67356 RepID=UPI0007C42F1D|nr:hypothetical protein [Streptomyces resistomycificus]